MNTARRSLRVRLLLIAAFIVVMALFVTGTGLVELFEQHSERRIGQEMDVHIEQLGGAIRLDDAGRLYLAREPSDPRFSQVFGGYYWEIRDPDRATLLRSRSLWDADIGDPAQDFDRGETRILEFFSSFGQELLAHERHFALSHGDEVRDLRILVAVNDELIDALAAGFMRDLVPVLFLLGLAMMAGFWFQIRAGLRPLKKLRTAINDVRSGREPRLVGRVPSEVDPLVEAVNSLLDLQEKSMLRARDRAADLAHGLKTPLTALKGDVEYLRRKGETRIAQDIEDIATRMGRHIDRELTRARIRHSDLSAQAPLRETFAGIIRTLSRTPQGQTVEFDLKVSETLRVRLDQDDLYEVAGSLMENAVRHARRRIRIRAVLAGPLVRITIEDDGPGLSAAQIETVLQRGKRLDTMGSGAGLGLSIVRDVLEASGVELELSRGELGGLKVRFDLPALL